MEIFLLIFRVFKVRVILIWNNLIIETVSEPDSLLLFFFISFLLSLPLSLSF